MPRRWIPLTTAALALCAAAYGDVEDIPTDIPGARMLILQRADDDHKGFALGAPHEGFDTHTSTIVAAITSELSCGRVIADGYRERAKGHYINVNRPTEVPGGGDEAVTPRATKVYEAYQKALLDAAGESKRLDLLVEIHGNSRTVVAEGRSVPLDVIECATTGFSRKELIALAKVYHDLKEEHGLPECYFEGIKEHDFYEYKGTRCRFYFRASIAKKLGALRRERAKRVLHFELPRSVRFEEDKRAKLVLAFNELLAKAWKIAD